LAHAWLVKSITAPNGISAARVFRCTFDTVDTSSAPLGGARGGRANVGAPAPLPPGLASVNVRRSPLLVVVRSSPLPIGGSDCDEDVVPMAPPSSSAMAGGAGARWTAAAGSSKASGSRAARAARAVHGVTFAQFAPAGSFVAA
jgi:hypothetical protein